MCNSPFWQAPERLEGQCHGTASDVYSFGVVMWELITLCVPWSDEDGGSGRQDVHNIQVINSVCQGVHLAVPAPGDICPALPIVDQDLLNLMNPCWTHEPSKRPSMHYVANMLTTLLARMQQQS
eukprot:gene25925-11602_t